MADANAVNVIIQLVERLGFPIACCGALFWRMIKSDEKHAEEMKQMSDALNNNTVALTRLTEKLEKEG